MKPLKDMTFDELAKYEAGRITLSIPEGNFNYAVWRAMEVALQWKAEQDKKKKEPEYGRN